MAKEYECAGIKIIEDPTVPNGMVRINQANGDSMLWPLGDPYAEFRERLPAVIEQVRKQISDTLYPEFNNLLQIADSGGSDRMTAAMAIAITDGAKLRLGRAGIRQG